MKAAISILLLLTPLCASAVVQRADQLRELGDDEIRKGVAVSIRGVVTFANPASGDFYFQDETGGVAVRPSAIRSPAELPPPGTRVEVSGVAAMGSYAPQLDAYGDAVKIHLLGPGETPPPAELAPTDLEGGQFDARRVALGGIVRTVRQEGRDLRLEVGVRVGRITLIVPGVDAAQVTNLLNARIRADGVLRAIANSRREWVGNMLLVPALSDLRVEVPPPRDLFALTPRRVDEVARFASPGWDVEPVLVRGTVTFHQHGYRFFLRGEDGSAIEAQTLMGWNGDLREGDQIETVAYPLLRNKRVILHDAVARILRRGPPPAPREVTIADALARDLNGDLVRIEGRLVQTALRAGKPMLFVESGGQIIEATCPLPGPADAYTRLLALPVGAVIRLDGIAEVLGAMQLDGSVTPTLVNLTLRSPADITILRPPPFWTTTRLLVAVAMLAAALALFAVWSALLRRRVTQQTAIIRENVRREAVWEERSRIAHDIHDDVGAALTQISLLGEVGRREGATADTMALQLGRVVRKSRDAVRALDEIVWTVNPVNDSIEKAASYFCHTAQDLLRDTPVRCRLLVADDLPAKNLGAKVRHNLFLAIKEAVNNVVKHAAATELRFSLAHRDGRLIARIEDDGRGFDPATADRTRHGLSGMQQRLADIGGTTRIESAPARGTTLEFSVPV